MFKPIIRKVLVFLHLLFFIPDPGAFGSVRLQHGERINSRLCFIGEVKGRSYVKLMLDPVKISSEFMSEGYELLKYKGTYFESARNRRYVVTGVFSTEERLWTFRCFNSANHQVFIFSGKQKQDGSIDGVWKSKTEVLCFYLRPQ